MTGDLARHRFGRWLTSPAALVGVIVLAGALRVAQIGEWSLWDDEENCLHFSQRPDKLVPSYYPIFFRSLQALFQVTGVSVVAGRAFSAALGLVSIVMTYALARRVASPAVANLAALFVTVSLGHVFWSQSIRYYTLVLTLQLLCMLMFLDGIATNRIRSFVAAAAAFALALATHFSAVLLAPVLVAHVALLWLRPAQPSDRSLRRLLGFGLPFAGVMAWFAWQFLKYRQLNLTEPSDAAPGQDLVGLGARIVVYFGAPIVLLAVFAPWAARQVAVRERQFLVLAAVLPMLELTVIASLKMSVVTWYYIFFALPMLAILAAATLDAWFAAGRRRVAIVAGGVAAAYYALFLVGYYTEMRGDRPPWRDAVACLRAEARVRVDESDNPEIYATVPGVVAYYLGVPIGETMGHPLVRSIPSRAPEPSNRDQWFVVEDRIMPPELRAEFNRRGRLVGRFAARTGPVDRSVVVYHLAARGSVRASHEEALP